jgi:FkbM family methyltransferase
MPCANVTPARAGIAAAAALAILLFLLSQQQPRTAAAQLAPAQTAGAAATQPPAPRAALARTGLVEPAVAAAPALPALPPLAPASAAAAAHLVEWSKACGASPTLPCCMGEWKRTAEPGDRPVHAANARAGAVQFRIAVYASGDIVSGQISGSQQWEGSITASVLEALTSAAATAAAAPGGADGADGRVALTDVGANTGWYSWAAAVNGHRVRAFEPFRQNINLMKLTACLNPAAARLVALHALALGNATQTCHVISETAINLGDGVTVCDPPHDIKQLPPGFQVIGSTPVVPLDALWDGARLSVFKMDTEGYELFVLKGAEGVLASHRAPRTLFLEFFPRLMRDRHSEPADLLRLLKASGYACAGGVLERDPEAYAASLGGGAADLHCELQRAR